MGSSDYLRPIKGACFVAVLGMILSVIAIASPEWTKTPSVTIGLWTLTTADGSSYYWTETGDYEDFFYSSWFMATRALVMAGLIIGALGVLFNIYVIRKNNKSGGTVLFIYYMLAFAILVSGAAVYSCSIPQGINSFGSITTNKDAIVEYLYLGSYGYSLWMCWVACGFFLLASGMSFEGSNQQARARRVKQLINA